MTSVLVLYFLTEGLIPPYAQKYFSSESPVTIYRLIIKTNYKLNQPIWKVGDWFEIEYYPFKGNSSKTSIIRRFNVIGIDDDKFSYRCFILAKTQEIIKSQNHNICVTSVGKNSYSSFHKSGTFGSEWYFFRMSDMMLIAIEDYYENKRHDLIGLSPWENSYIPELGVIPRFPVSCGRQLFPDRQLTDSMGEIIEENYPSIRIITDYQPSQFTIVNKNSYTILIGSYICVWKDNEIWWSYCYKVIGENQNKLYAKLLRYSGKR